MYVVQCKFNLILKENELSAIFIMKKGQIDGFGVSVFL